MTAKTRFDLDGYYIHRAGSFIGKAQTAGGPHPVHVLTRFSLDGDFIHRAGSFAGKATVAVTIANLSPLLTGAVNGFRGSYWKGRSS